MVFWRWNWFSDGGDNEMEFSCAVIGLSRCFCSGIIVWLKFYLIGKYFRSVGYSPNRKRHRQFINFKYFTDGTGRHGVFNSQLTPICWLYEFDSIRWSLSIFMIVCPCSRASSISINIWTALECVFVKFCQSLLKMRHKSIPSADHLMQNARVIVDKFKSFWTWMEFSKKLRRDLIR